MSRASVIVVLLLATALALGALYVITQQQSGQPSNQAAPGDTTSTVLEFDPANVNTIAVRTGNEPEQLAVRNSTGGWAYTTTDGWPLDPTLVTTALNSIATLQALPTEQDLDPASIGESEALSISLRLSDAASHTISISRDAAGGRAPAIINQSKPVLIPAAALSLFDPKQAFGPAAWRVTSSALPGAMNNPTRIKVTHPKHSYTIERTSSGWEFTEPISAVATNAQESLRALLSEVSMTEFSFARALFPPTITVTTPNGTRSLGLSDTVNRAAVASVTLPGTFQNILAKTNTPLEQLLSPERFLPRTVIDALPGDIRVLGTNNNAYEQTLDGWEDDAGSQLAPPVSQSIESFLLALTNGSATPAILPRASLATTFLTIVTRTEPAPQTFAVTQVAQQIQLSQGRLAWTLPVTVIAPWLEIASSPQPSDTTPTPPTGSSTPPNPLPEK